MATVAVTGASGFLGRHVLAALSKTGADVVAHSRSPRSDPNATDRIRWTAFDHTAAPDDAFDRLGRPDIVIYLAWEGLPNYLAARHVDVELPAQVRFLRQLTAAGLKTLVVAGTCFEYGMQSGCLHEDLPPLPPNPYGIAKNSVREQLQIPTEQTKTDLRWLRLFYLYGQGQAPTSLYAQFCAAVARGDKRFDMSKGEQVRDFMKAEDAANAIAALALAPHAPRLLNVCSGVPTTVRGLVEQWRADMGADIELNLGVFPYPAYEPLAFWGDTRRLVAALRYPASSGQRTKI